MIAPFLEQMLYLKFFKLLGGGSKFLPKFLKNSQLKMINVPKEVQFEVVNSVPLYRLQHGGNLKM